jgi:heme/copper-type cytochrome/quinol oxidase subunit 2
MNLSTFIYIATFLDGVDAVAKLLAFFAAIGSIVTFIMFMLVRAANVSDDKFDDAEAFIKNMIIKLWLPAFFVLSLVAIAIPPKTEMYAMYGADIVTKMVDDTNLQQVDNDTQEIVHSLSIILKGAADELEKSKENK